MSTLPLFDRHAEFAVIDPPKLRPYQSRAIETLRTRVREGKRRILLVAPTGSGKTVMLSSIIRTSTLRVLFVAHRMELIDQCVDQLRRAGITNVGVIRGSDSRVNPEATTQVASIQTLARRDKPEAGIVIIDEAHRAVSDSYLKLLEHYQDAIVLGFTATPTRYDNRPLGNLFESLEVVCTYETLIKQGFIVAPHCYSAPIPPDLSSIQTVNNDYEEGALAEEMGKAVLVGNLFEHWQDLASTHVMEDGRIVKGERRRTFIFAVNIHHSMAICERFSKEGIRIAHIDGTTPEGERRKTLRALGEGLIDAISNVGVLLEGVDIPSVKCVLHARPTQSLVLWRQSGGRMLRPWKGITPLLLDHACNIERLGFPHEDVHWELKDRARKIEGKPAMRICKGCFAYLPAYKKLCPYCRTEAPARSEIDELDLPEERKGKLRQMPITPQAMRQLYYETMVRLARHKGYKPGFASARYKEKYGHWPPWAWSDETKSSFASDPIWQSNFEKHQQMKAKKR